MKEYGTEAIRNITFIGHQGSGKTSLSEIILFAANEINRIGSIAEGNTISDYTQMRLKNRYPSQLHSCIANGTTQR